MRRRALPVALVTFVTLALFGATVAAQPAPAPASAPTVAAPAASAPAATAGPSARAVPEGFRPLAPGESAAPPDSLSAPGLVKTAYGLIWLAVIVYLVGLWRRNRRLGDEVAELRARFDRKIKADQVRP